MPIKIIWEERISFFVSNYANTNITYMLRNICLYSALLLYRQGLIEFLPNSSTSLIMTPPIWRSPLTLRVLSTWKQKIIKLITNMNNYFGTNQSSYTVETKW